MRIVVPLTVLTVIAAVPLIAQTPPATVPGKADVSRVTAGNYKVESTHALIEWSVNHFGFNDYYGIFGSPTGTMTLNPAKPNMTSVTIDIPVSNLAVANEKLAVHMKGADFFDVEKFTTAKFVSTKVVATGQTANISGDLTIKGVTKPVLLAATFVGAGVNPYSKKATVGFHATTTIKRSDWGMGYGVPMVGDAVALKISVAFEKEESQAIMTPPKAPLPSN